MALRLSERMQAILFATVVVAAIAGLYGATQLTQPAPVLPYAVHVVHLRIYGPAWTIRYDPIETVNNTAFSLLVEAGHHLRFAVSYTPYEIPKGMFVTEINGSRNGEGGRYWQYWVNDIYGNVAADHQAIQDGDAVVWTLSVPQGGG